MRWHNAGLTGAASPPWRPKGRGLYPASSGRGPQAAGPTPAVDAAGRPRFQGVIWGLGGW